MPFLVAILSLGIPLAIHCTARSVVCASTLFIENTFPTLNFN